MCAAAQLDNTVLQYLLSTKKLWITTTFLKNIFDDFQVCLSILRLADKIAGHCAITAVLAMSSLGIIAR